MCVCVLAGGKRSLELFLELLGATRRGGKQKEEDKGKGTTKRKDGRMEMVVVVVVVACNAILHSGIGVKHPDDNDANFRWNS